MRAVGLGLVAALAAAAVAGCVPDDRGAVLLHLNARTAGSPATPTYSSSTAAAAVGDDGLLHLTATSNQGLLRLVLANSLMLGATIELPPDGLHFAIGDADWANRGGSVVVLSLDPVILGFVAVPMEARSTAAVGSFVFDGGGTFRNEE